MKKLLDLRVILIILLVLSWVIVGIFFFKFKGDTESQLAEKDAQIADLETSLADIGELVPAYVVINDVPSGKQIEESDLQQIDVPLSMSTNLVQDIDELVGKYFKLGLTSGTVVTSDCIYEEVITSDMRYYDVITDILPIGLKPGAFVDIRIKFGTGADYIGVAHRQVVQINGNALKMILTEEDIHFLSSMIVDNLVYNQRFQATIDVNNDGIVDKDDKVDAIGCYIYAVEYVEGGIQDKGAEFYSPSIVVQSIMTKDPNILSTAITPEDKLLKRQLIDAGLFGGSENYFNSRILDYVNNVIKEGQKIYDKRVEEELKNAE